MRFFHPHGWFYLSATNPRPLMSSQYTKATTLKHSTLYPNVNILPPSPSPAPNVTFFGPTSNHRHKTWQTLRWKPCATLAISLWYTLNSIILTPVMSHTLISRNPRERMFVVQISLLIVTFLILTSQNLSLMQTNKEINPHPRIAPCVKCGVSSSSSSYATCWMLVHASTTSPGKA
jgi:hypothetical protein